MPTATEASPNHGFIQETLNFERAPLVENKTHVFTKPCPHKPFVQSSVQTTALLHVAAIQLCCCLASNYRGAPIFPKGSNNLCSELLKQFTAANFEKLPRPPTPSHSIPTCTGHCVIGARAGLVPAGSITAGATAGSGESLCVMSSARDQNCWSHGDSHGLVGIN